jgi:hypothetical protein
LNIDELINIFLINYFCPQELDPTDPVASIIFI